MAEKNYQLQVYDSEYSLEKVQKDYGEKAPGDKFSQAFTPLKGQLFGRPWEDGFKKKHIKTLNLKPIGLGRKWMDINKVLAPVTIKALTEVAEYCRYSGYKIRQIGGYYYRFKKNESNKDRYLRNAEFQHQVIQWRKSRGEAVDKDWSSVWYDWGARYLAESGRLIKENRLGHLSNHAFGSAIDINHPENGMGARKWDMPREIVHIMRKYGYDWGGFYYSKKLNRLIPDAMHFEYMLKKIAGRSFVYFPLQKRYSATPPAYYHMNESNLGGYYPLSLNRGLHGGIHLPHTSKSYTQVRCCLPGYIVAARLSTTSIGNNGLLREFNAGNPLGFVLIRHELLRIKDGNVDDKEPMVIYSLYMHLSEPDWDSPGEYSDKVAWLKRFLQMQFGAVVIVDPQDKRFGETLWVSEKVPKDATEFKVGKETIKAKENNARKALAKSPPEDVSEAVEGFKKGHVVTFDRPLLKIEAGEIIGLVEAEAKVKTRVVHWEVLSPGGSDSGVRQLIGLDGDLKGLFKDFKETQENNYFEADELKKLKDHLSQTEQALFEPAIQAIESATSHAQELSALKTYSEQVGKLYQKQPWRLTPDKDDAHSLADFTYPVTLHINNPHAFKGKLDIQVIFKNEKRREIGKGSITITDFSKTEYVVQVPALTDTISLQCGGVYLDEKFTAEKSEKERLKRVKGEVLDLLKPMSQSRFRNVLTEHVNEWTEAGIKALLKTLNVGTLCGTLGTLLT